MAEFVLPAKVEEDPLRDCEPDMFARCPMKSEDQLNFGIKVKYEAEANFQFVDCGVKVEDALTLNTDFPSKSIDTQFNEQQPQSTTRSSLDNKILLIVPVKETVKGFDKKEFSLQSVINIYKNSPDPVTFITDKCQQPHNKISRRSNLKSRLYECDFCAKKITGKTLLGLHIFSHTGFKPYACLLCPAKFALGNILKSHIQSHAGRKMYPKYTRRKNYPRIDYFKKMQSTTNLFLNEGFFESV